MISESMYEDIERQVMPLIRRKAAKLKGYMELEDAIQEARLVLFRVLQSYDYTRQPDLERYVAVCLNNAFAAQYHKATAQCRMPRRASQELDGTYSCVPSPPNQLLAEPEDDTGDLEQIQILRDEATDVELIVAATEGLLSEREREVLLCIVQPPAEITVSPFDSGFNIQLAAYLGITKNMLDWSLHRVRQALLEVMRLPEFADHIGSLVSRDGWPHIECTEYWHDTDMVEWTIAERGLDGTVRDEKRQQVGDAECWSVVYSWGEAMFLRFGELTATLVLEGRFNHNSGTLFGAQYGSQDIPIPWYQRCMRMIRGS